jgi:hypothetical protein
MTSRTRRSLSPPWSRPNETKDTDIEEEGFNELLQVDLPGPFGASSPATLFGATTCTNDTSGSGW